MTILPQLRDQAHVVRRVTVDDTQAVVVLDAPEEVFSCSITTPTSEAGADGSPRDWPAATLRHAEGVRAPAGEALRAGDRVEDGHGAVWELLRPSRPLRAARKVVGHQAPVQLVSVLYPLAAVVRTQGGTDVLADNVPVVVFTPRRSRESTGEYTDLQGECPIEYRVALANQNCELHVGDIRYRVNEASPEYAEPRVRLTLRRVGG